ncbi:MAG TPA: tRNA (N6-threonylcarbamoyladenosine(37)-N6)-methyltransferase TrmO [Polyangiaceae bacterium]|nr:tRNA (N6-threonylcarbamoyladenosine(37)-N6)-methyltransferase TrmO [Polyangiaceae bacterium]
MTELAAPETLTLRPIGIVRSPFLERSSAPRQARAARGATGTLELYSSSGIHHALDDLASFRFIWVLFWFHENKGFKSKVLPPRSSKRRGVFATRSPYRPNPIGLSAVELIGIEGLTLSVRNLDMLDGTPILDLKPYVPYTDSIPEAQNGWLDAEAAPADPLPDYEVGFAPRALEQLAFLSEHGVQVRERVEDALRLGAQPHAYRRIKQKGDAFVLAHKAWRFDFSIAGRCVSVNNIGTGYRPSVLHSGTGAELDLHRAFVARFG